MYFKINSETLEALQASFSYEQLDFFVQRFHDEVEAGYRRIFLLIENGDLKGIEDEAHRLRGACQAMGAESLSLSLGGLIEAAREGDWQLLESALRQFAELIPYTARAIKAELMSDH